MFMTVDDITYSDIMPKNYRMDPETEDMLYGDELEDGMRVLIEHALREDDRSIVPYQIVVSNRWCQVTKIRKDYPMVSFVGLYDDGEKHMRISSKSTGWLVQLDSIPIETEE